MPLWQRRLILGYFRRSTASRLMKVILHYALVRPQLQCSVWVGSSQYNRATGRKSSRGQWRWLTDCRISFMRKGWEEKVQEGTHECVQISEGRIQRIWFQALSSIQWQIKSQWAQAGAQILSEHQGTLLYCAVDWALALAARRGGRISILGDIQKLSGHCPGQTSLGVFPGGLDNPEVPSNSALLGFCDLIISALNH